MISDKCHSSECHLCYLWDCEHGCHVDMRPETEKALTVLKAYNPFLTTKQIAQQTGLSRRFVINTLFLNPRRVTVVKPESKRAVD